MIPGPVLLMLVQALAGVPGQEASAPVSSSAAGDGAAPCADCHPSIVESYRRTGMARALEPLREGELAGLASVLEPATGFRYHFEGDGSGARIVETREAQAGRPSHLDSAPLVCAIGAGALDRSFVALRSGRLWLAPLEVLHGGGKPHAAFAPSHAIQPGTRFSFPVTPECLGCHTDAPPPRDWPLNRRPSSWQPRGISCAACHGELEPHVRFRSAELAGESPSGADPIPDLSALARERRVSVCAACHLQGDARIELEPGAPGLPPPGGDVLARRAVFVAAHAAEELGFVSHVQRLVLSRCYLESRELACESCHDPHRSLSEPREKERVRAACGRCHADAAAPATTAQAAAACALPPGERAGRDCVSCHMRTSGVFDVAEVRIHDHWIRADPGPEGARGPLRFPESSAGDWRRFAWPGAPPVEHADDPGLWLMALAHGGHLERARARLSEPPGPLAARLPMYHHVRGSLLERSGRLPEARASYEKALELDPELAEPAVNLGALLARLGEPRAGLEVLDHLLARHPQADTALRNRAIVRLELGDEEGALADLERAQALLPDAELARALAKSYRSLGDTDRARRWEDEARRLDPR